MSLKIVGTAKPLSNCLLLNSAMTQEVNKSREVEDLPTTTHLVQFSSGLINSLYYERPTLHRIYRVKRQVGLV